MMVTVPISRIFPLRSKCCRLFRTFSFFFRLSHLSLQYRDQSHHVYCGDTGLSGWPLRSSVSTLHAHTVTPFFQRTSKTSSIPGRSILTPSSILLRVFLPHITTLQFPAGPQADMPCLCKEGWLAGLGNECLVSQITRTCLARRCSEPGSRSRLSSRLFPRVLTHSTTTDRLLPTPTPSLTVTVLLVHSRRFPRCLGSLLLLLTSSTSSSYRHVQYVRPTPPSATLSLCLGLRCVISCLYLIPVFAIPSLAAFPRTSLC